LNDSLCDFGRYSRKHVGIKIEIGNVGRNILVNHQGGLLLLRLLINLLVTQVPVGLGTGGGYISFQGVRAAHPALGIFVVPDPWDCPAQPC